MTATTKLRYFSVHWHLALALLTCLIELPCRAETPACSGGTTAILVDITVSNKVSAVSKFESAINGIFERISHDEKSALNSEVVVSFMDDQGEHPEEWRVRFPSNLGVQRRNLRKSAAELRSRFLESRSKILNPARPYKRTLLIEPIKRTLTGLGACDTLIVVSDLCVVDGRDNQHENGKFGVPPNLAGLVKARVLFKEFRVERDGQLQDRIDSIEAWWNDVFFGTSAFSKMSEEKSALTVLYPRLLEARGRDRGEARIRSEKADISRVEQIRAKARHRQNEILIASRRAPLSGCLRQLTHGNRGDASTGRYRVKIKIGSTGRPKLITFLTDPEQNVSKCVRDVLNTITFWRTNGSTYWHEQMISLGG